MTDWKTTVKADVVKAESVSSELVTKLATLPKLAILAVVGFGVFAVAHWVF